MKANTDTPITEKIVIKEYRNTHNNIKGWIICYLVNHTRSTSLTRALVISSAADGQLGKEFCEALKENYQ